MTVCESILSSILGVLLNVVKACRKLLRLVKMIGLPLLFALFSDARQPKPTMA